MIPRNESNYPLYNGQAKNSVAHIARINFHEITQLSYHRVFCDIIIILQIVHAYRIECGIICSVIHGQSVFLIKSVSTAETHITEQLDYFYFLVNDIGEYNSYYQIR